MPIMAKKHSKRVRAESRPALSEWAIRLRAMRKLRNLTQQEAAAKADVSTSVWVAWENDDRKPSRFIKDHILSVFPDL